MSMTLLQPFPITGRKADFVKGVGAVKHDAFPLKSSGSSTKCSDGSGRLSPACCCRFTLKMEHFGASITVVHGVTTSLHLSSFSFHLKMGEEKINENTERKRKKEIY
jgi:hypothetical protein